MLEQTELKKLINKSYENRIQILKMNKQCSAHIGGAFSCIDILTTLYHKILKHDPRNPRWEDWDRFILSAGHKGVAQYAVLQSIGYFREEVLWKLGKLNSEIGDHPNEKAMPGIEFPTGSLGHGLSAGSGIAIAGKINKKDYKVFVLLGDGECEEGTVWEAAMAAAQHKLDNLIAIIDRNGLQVNGWTKDIMSTAILEEKFSSFGWEVRNINGHNFQQIYTSLAAVPFNDGKPSCIVADTIKCKGISFAENDFLTHNCFWQESKIDEAIMEVQKNQKQELSLIK